MTIEAHRKIDLAAEQLEAAIEMCGAGKFAAAATLAGAAEEIVGRHIQQRLRLEPYIDNMAKDVSKVYERLKGSSLSLKEAKKIINSTRNSLKHMDDEDDSTIHVNLEDEAKTLIWRAVDNYDRIHMPFNSTIAGFPANVSGA